MHYPTFDAETFSPNKLIVSSILFLELSGLARVAFLKAIYRFVISWFRFKETDSIGHRDNSGEIYVLTLSLWVDVAKRTESNS